MLVITFLFIGLKSSAYGFGLVNNDNYRPNAAKYGKLIEEYDGVYIGPDDNSLYLTFDCGYENGYTMDILDTLKKTNTKALFFITGHYLNSVPDIVQRMIDDGHIIGNHTYSHKDFTASSNEYIINDLKKLETEFYNKFNVEMSKYVRPPRGEFDDRSLKLLNENGYKSVFWSLAYVDWDKDKFNGNNYSYNQVMKKVHSGAIILMHTVSKDNKVDLELIIDTLKNKGYVFKSIDNVL